MAARFSLVCFGLVLVQQFPSVPSVFLELAGSPNLKGVACFFGFLRPFLREIGANDPKRS